MDSHNEDGDGRGGARYDPELELRLLEAGMFVDQTRLKMRLIPGGWHGFEDVPVRPRKTKTTVAFDADLVDWFRRMGEGWHVRMNHVLRVFMLAVQSKEIHTRSRLRLAGPPADPAAVMALTGATGTG